MATAANSTDTAEVAVQERIARLEHDLGDLDDPGNPLGSDQLLAADGDERLLPHAERLLDGFGLNAEFVPEELGGRLDRLDTLARVLRSVFRRDASLGLGYGVTSYLAAVVVWAGGSARQRREAADLLLAGGRMACAYPEPAPGNDFLRNRVTAVPDGEGYRLSGRKEALNNAGRAQSLVVFARTPHLGEGSQTAFLLPGASGEPGGPALLSRRRTNGIRGCVVQGLEFAGLRLDRDRLLGPEGDGWALAARAFPATRSTGCSMALGCADTALRTTVSFARAHRSRSRASVHTARIRTALIEAFADLLVCDCLSLVATRAVHLLPRESGTLSAVAKYLLPPFLTEMVYDLSIVLGSEAYATTGSYGLFQKAVRDLPMIGLGSAGTAASRSAIVAHLLRLPRLRAPGGTPAPDLLFRPFDPRLPPFGTDEPPPAPDGDSLLGSLEDTVASLPAAEGDCGAELGVLAGALTVELHRLRDACAQLAATRPGPTLSPRAYALADRYALVAAGAACLRVWQQHIGTGGFLGDPAWAVLALTRVVGRLDRLASRLPDTAAARVLDELLYRFDDARSYDLYAAPLGR